MRCEDAQEHILESFEGPLAGWSDVEIHLAACATCREFAEAQRMLEARLGAALPPPELSPDFRASLRKRIRRDPASAWPDSLPEIAHLAGCGFATAICALILPGPAATVWAIGAVLTAATYWLQTVLLTALDEMDEIRTSTSARTGSGGCRAPCP